MEDCEDASWISYPYASGPAKIALSDGASESAFARGWAQILTRAFIYCPPDLPGLDDTSLNLWLGQGAMEWHRMVPWERIPWHGEAKTRYGSLATLLGMNISQTPEPTGAYKWRAVAVGDCCLFVVRDNALMLSFPLQDSGQFNNAPPLICSNPANNGRLWSWVRREDGECLPGDLIVLASDALACWILQQNESGGRPWQTLLSLGSDVEWDDWVLARRNDLSMRNDDTTFIAIKVE